MRLVSQNEASFCSSSEAEKRVGSQRYRSRCIEHFGDFFSAGSCGLLRLRETTLKQTVAKATSPRLGHREPAVQDGPTSHKHGRRFAHRGPSLEVGRGGVSGWRARQTYTPIGAGSNLLRFVLLGKSGKSQKPHKCMCLLWEGLARDEADMSFLFGRLSPPVEISGRGQYRKCPGIPTSETYLSIVVLYCTVLLLAAFTNNANNGDLYSALLSAKAKELHMPFHPSH